MSDPAIRNVRCTSTPAVRCAHIAVIRTIDRGTLAYGEDP